MQIIPAAWTWLVLGVVSLMAAGAAGLELPPAVQDKGSGPLSGASIESPVHSSPECVPEWGSWGEPPGTSNFVNACCTWDPDGAGPLPEQLVAGGDFTEAGGVTVNSIARWDGSQWQPLGSGMDARVHALTTWDPDGAGPIPAQLVAGGDFTTAGGITVNRIARWDGTQWLPFGSGMNASVRSLATWDPDGSGPLAPQLVAGGHFTTAGGVTINYIARWDGAQWLPFGSGMNGGVWALTTIDPGGSGPLAPQLVAGGSFTTAGGVTAYFIARWDGAEWLPIGSGVTGPVSALAMWDPDGSEPLAPQLVAGGLFTYAGGIGVNRVARWDGTQWLPFGSGVDNDVFALMSWDPDGAGPLPPELVAGGSFTFAGGVLTSGIARWDGIQWRRFGSVTPMRVAGLTTWDPDGAGPLSPQLVAGGLGVGNIVRWDGTQWLLFGSGMNNAVSALGTWDPDGAGPLPPQLVAGGWFIVMRGERVNSIARWDGTRWRPFGSGMDNSVSALETWDPDGAGPLPPQLVAGGWFSTAGGVGARSIARWDGTQWLPFGSGTDGTVRALTTWDPDGAGPLPAQLVAGGSFTRVGGVTANYIARWDGSQWHPFGSGMNGWVVALTTWDPDGAGPLPPQLVAGGWFITAGGVTVNYITRWDGAQWLPIGSGMDGWVHALAAWEPDGPGPIAPQLVAGGDFVSAGGVTVNMIARWDGSQWLPFGSGMNGSVMAFTTLDPDGAGPLPPQLVSGGGFTTAGGVSANGAARWDGAQWLPFGSGLNNTVNALKPWDPDGAGPLQTQLVAGGNFRIAGGIPAGYIASWGCSLPPPCPGASPGACSRADWNEDGTIDFNDFLAFLNTFNAEDPCADLNADGVVDPNDFLTFLNLFNAGC